MIRAYHLFTGPDGNSHVEKGRLGVGALVHAESIEFQESPVHASFDWHDAPASQYVLTLAGTLEFTTVDGETFTIHPGEVLIARDQTGTGHKWRLLDDQPWKRAYVIFKAGADPQFIRDSG